MFSYWKQAPFAQLLVPLVLGIALHMYFPSISWQLVVVIMCAAALAYGVLYFLNKKLKG
jgi:hypothetical protein